MFSKLHLFVALTHKHRSEMALRRRVGLLLAVFLSLGVPSAVHGASGAVSINAPVPDDLKDLVAAMLRRERPQDAETALAGAKMVDVSGRHGSPLIMRIEADCRESLCMTIIARVVQGAIVPELRINAGPSVYLHDSARSLWGSDHPVWSLVFEGASGSRLIAMLRNGLWVVEANGPWRPPEASTTEEPRPSSPPVPFEQFRRQLGLEP